MAVLDAILMLINPHYAISWWTVGIPTFGKYAILVIFLFSEIMFMLEIRRADWLVYLDIALLNLIMAHLFWT